MITHQPGARPTIQVKRPTVFGQEVSRELEASKADVDNSEEEEDNVLGHEVDTVQLREGREHGVAIQGAAVLDETDGACGHNEDNNQAAERKQDVHPVVGACMRDADSNAENLYRLVADPADHYLDWEGRRCGHLWYCCFPWCQE